MILYTINDRCNMTYEYYIKQTILKTINDRCNMTSGDKNLPMTMVEGRINIIIAKNPKLINSFIEQKTIL